MARRARQFLPRFSQAAGCQSVSILVYSSLLKAIVVVHLEKISG